MIEVGQECSATESWENLDDVGRKLRNVSAVGEASEKKLKGAFAEWCNV